MSGARSKPTMRTRVEWATMSVALTLTKQRFDDVGGFAWSAISPYGPISAAHGAAPRGERPVPPHIPEGRTLVAGMPKKPLLAISRFKARSRWAAQRAALTAPFDKKIFRRHSPVHQSTYVENIAGQIRPLVRSFCRLGFDPLEQG